MGDLGEEQRLGGQFGGPTHKRVAAPNDRNRQIDLVTSDDLDLRGHLGLRTMLRYVTDPNHVDSWAAYALILDILRRKRH